MPACGPTQSPTAPQNEGEVAGSTQVLPQSTNGEGQLAFPASGALPPSGCTMAPSAPASSRPASRTSTAASRPSHEHAPKVPTAEQVCAPIAPLVHAHALDAPGVHSETVWAAEHPAAKNKTHAPMRTHRTESIAVMGTSVLEARPVELPSDPRTPGRTMREHTRSTWADDRKHGAIVSACGSWERSPHEPALRAWSEDTRAERSRLGVASKLRELAPGVRTGPLVAFSA